MQGEHDRWNFTTGERIAWLMGRQGRKAGELAKAIGTDATSFWRYRKDGRTIPSDILSKLADELNTSADFLLCRTDDPGPYSGDSATARKLGPAIWGTSAAPDELVLASG